MTAHRARPAARPRARPRPGLGHRTLRPTLPPTNAALADEVTAPEVNPAGLQFTRRPDAHLPARAEPQPRLHRRRPLLRLHLLRLGRARRRAGLGARSARRRRAHRLPEDVVHLLRGWAVALRRHQLQRLHPRPRQRAGPQHLGPRARQSPEPLRSPSGCRSRTSATRRASRTWELAFGVRPWGEWLTLGANWQFPGFGTLDQSRVGAVVQVEAMKGRGARHLGDQELARAQRPVVLAGVAHREHGARGPRLRAGRRPERHRPRDHRPAVGGPLPERGSLRRLRRGARPRRCAVRRGHRARAASGSARTTPT